MLHFGHAYLSCLLPTFARQFIFTSLSLLVSLYFHFSLAPIRFRVPLLYPLHKLRFKVTQTSFGFNLPLLTFLLVKRISLWPDARRSPPFFLSTFSFFSSREIKNSMIRCKSTTNMPVIILINSHDRHAILSVPPIERDKQINASGSFRLSLDHYWRIFTKWSRYSFK